VTLVARYVFFKPRIVAILAGGLTAAGKDKVKDDIIAQLQTYVDALSAGQPAKSEDLLNAIKKVKEVSKPKIVDVMAWRSDIARPGAESVVDALLSTINAAPAGDDAALRAALLTTLTDATPTAPTGSRVPDRSLVQGASGQRATDAEIDAGAFQVAATVNGEAWWVVLDLDRADIRFLES
jgi:hypothetical protein